MVDLHATADARNEMRRGLETPAITRNPSIAHILLSRTVFAAYQRILERIAGIILTVVYLSSTAKPANKSVLFD